MRSAPSSLLWQPLACDTGGTHGFFKFEIESQVGEMFNIHSIPNPRKNILIIHYIAVLKPRLLPAFAPALPMATNVVSKDKALKRCDELDVTGLCIDAVCENCGVLDGEGCRLALLKLYYYHY